MEDDYLLRHVSSRNYGELTEPVAPSPPLKRRKAGTFAPGHEPKNKGRKWDEWMSPEAQERVRAQLRKTRHNGNPNWVNGCKAHNAVEVVAFKDGKKVGIYKSATYAAQQLGLQARNVRSCLTGKRHSCGGYIFYRRDDREAWMTALVTHSDVPAGYHMCANGRIFPDKRRHWKKKKKTLFIDI